MFMNIMSISNIRIMGMLHFHQNDTLDIYLMFSEDNTLVY